MTVTQTIDLLKQKASPQYLAGMGRFGIDNSRALGVKIPDVRAVGKLIETNHNLALQLWETGIHEARILATIIADPGQVTPRLMNKWVHDFYSWDICDQACSNLFDRTPFAAERSLEYCQSELEFVKRTGFVLMAESAVHNKKATDDIFLAMLPIIEREAWDGRNFVKKAINWALRQIGKRNSLLRHAAIDCAERILEQDSKAAKWIARDALRELNGNNIFDQPKTTIMKKLLLLALLAVSAAAFAQTQPAGKTNPLYDEALAKKLGADDYGMRKYVMAFLKTGPTKIADKAKMADLQKAHLKNISKLADEGKLVVAGPFMDPGEVEGIFIFDTPTIEEAKKLTETDPAIKAGVLVMELRPFYCSAALMEVTKTHKKLAKKDFTD